MQTSSDTETLINGGICFNDCLSQEYVKYVNMWNFQVLWVWEKLLYFKISRTKAATFVVIRYKCNYAVIQIPELQNQRPLHRTTNKEPTIFQLQFIHS